MDTHQLISDDDLDRLPDDDQDAFVEFARIASQNLRTEIAELDLTDDRNDDWAYANEARRSFMSLMIAAAKRYEIEGIASYELVHVRDYQTSDYLQFKADLDHYVSQLRISKARKNRSNSVRMSEKVRDRIRAHVEALRAEITKSDLPKDRAEALIKRLNEFESELDKQRISLVALALIAVEVAIVPGALWSSYQLTSGILTKVYEAVAEAREDESRAKELTSSSPQRVLSPPNNASPRRIDYKLNDDIPF